jgi:hypothetical protein
MRRPVRWCRYDITVTSGGHTWSWREVDPVEAMAKARGQLIPPSVGDRFVGPDETRRLLSGRALSAICHDGAAVTITPILT